VKDKNEIKIKPMFVNIKFSNQSIDNIEFSKHKMLFIQNCILSKIEFSQIPINWKFFWCEFASRCLLQVNI